MYLTAWLAAAATAIGVMLVMGLSCERGNPGDSYVPRRTPRADTASHPRSQPAAGSVTDALTEELGYAIAQLQWQQQFPAVPENVLTAASEKRAAHHHPLGFRFPEDVAADTPDTWVGGTVRVTAAAVYCDRPDLVNGANASRALAAYRMGAFNRSRYVQPFDSLGLYDLTAAVTRSCAGQVSCHYAFTDPPPVRGCPGKLVVDYICEDRGEASHPRGVLSRNPASGLELRCDVPPPKPSEPRVGQVVPVRYREAYTNAEWHVWPIQFTIPESKFVASVPWKTRDFAVLFPGNKKTYAFEDAGRTASALTGPDVDYFESYAHAYYCITRKKYGWDTLRHYEILAAGCVPYFVDLHRLPAATMVLYPKDLILEAMHLPGVHFDSSYAGSFHEPSAFRIDHSVFDKTRYFELASKILNYARTRLSAERLSQYVLGVLHAEGGAANPRRVLFISQCFKDYLADSFWIGFNNLHERDVIEDFTHVVATSAGTHFLRDEQYNRGCDHGVKDHLVATDKRLDKEGFYRKVTGWGQNAASNRMTDGVAYIEGTAAVENIRRRIREKYYDVIVYGSASRSLAFFEDVVQHYDRSRIALLLGEDKPETLFGMNPVKQFKQGVMFSRELFDDADGATYHNYYNYNAPGAADVDGYHCCDGSHETTAHLYWPRPTHPTDALWKHLGAEGATDLVCLGWARMGYAPDGQYARIRYDAPTTFNCATERRGGPFMDPAPAKPKKCECLSFEDAAVV